VDLETKGYSSASQDVRFLHGRVQEVPIPPMLPPLPPFNPINFMSSSAEKQTNKE
jgi:hypothetical protein